MFTRTYFQPSKNRSLSADGRIAKVVRNVGEMGANLSTHGAITLRLKKREVTTKVAPPDRRAGELDSDDREVSGSSGDQSSSGCVRKRPPSKRRRIVINVSGFRYMTYVKTLERFPTTLLGNKDKRDLFYDEDHDEYFFDRNIQVFELILYFYQSNGRLVCPPELAPEILLEEVEFFELGENAVNAVRDILNDDDGPERLLALPETRIQRLIWKLFEFPDSSKAARVLALLSVSVIVASIVVLCIETLPEFTVLSEDNIPVNDTAKQQEITRHNAYARSVKAVFALLEIAFISWFTFEYLVRLFASPKKWFFVRSFLNVIDLLAILPFYVELALKNSSSQNFSLAFLRILRLVRVFRIFKLSRHSSGLQILGLTLRKSLRELGLLIFFLAIGVVIFSSMVYYAENGEEETFFRSIPDAFWWALVTMTTVGYGDMYPQTLWGKVVGSCCALCGVLAIALPVPVIVSNFDTIYKKYRSRKLKQQGQFEGDDDKHRKLSLFSSRKTSQNNDLQTEPQDVELELLNGNDQSKTDISEEKWNGNVVRVEKKEAQNGCEPSLTSDRNNSPREKGLNFDPDNPSEIVSLLVDEQESFAKLDQTNV
ncbi:shaker-related potassium channel tsha2-like isoform X2 [Montipora capricornis]|uniref:shaker-related potassium channel tsha2-like isoform X2 n=1 Tax=Montipora foliosa TaxID=591990 RepID=UPI0035F1DA26